ncbi:SDR family oxidoreductase [Rhodopseudomonas palustris]|uniref:SDR family oxidoreductase n=1 Tax=Rhodopseudomonas palustris TaxID=1076 RepID=A0A418V113_RHOPL|nr:SDR family oxidoreductase [Rhodopseudomonas palustris]RJF69505.1 SDR family oxidoreductase [Rhodopseudomonas palustris]
MDLNLNGKKVLITGASQGIGEGLAKAFAEEGCDLHLTARSADVLEQLRSELSAKHPVQVTVQPIDLTADGAADAVADAAGDVDVLINNAGTVPSGYLWQVDSDAWKTGWALKGFGYVDLTRAIYPKMKARGGGVILNNIGNGGEVCDPAYIAGATANASLMAFTRALGGTSLDDNIRVVGVNPGPVDTSRIYNMLRKRAASDLGDADRYQELVERYPLKRAASVREITDLFLFLASERSGYTSGTIITVDGGIASRRSIV